MCVSTLLSDRCLLLLVLLLRWMVLLLLVIFYAIIRHLVSAAGAALFGLLFNHFKSHFYWYVNWFLNESTKNGVVILPAVEFIRSAADASSSVLSKTPRTHIHSDLFFILLSFKSIKRVFHDALIWIYKMGCVFVLAIIDLGHSELRAFSAAVFINFIQRSDRQFQLGCAGFNLICVACAIVARCVHGMAVQQLQQKWQIGWQAGPDTLGCITGLHARTKLHVH